MAKLTGYNKIAVITNGYYGKDYHYALYDDSIKAGDCVLVTGAAQGTIFTVKKVIDVCSSNYKNAQSLTAEVIGRVEAESYNNRVENRKKADELKKNMYARKKEIENRKNDEYYAELDPEYALMLKTLQELQC